MDQHLIDDTDLDHLVNGEQAPPRRGRGRPPKISAPPEPAGLTFSEFEADMLADELVDRAADIVRDDSEDKYLQKRAKFLRDTAAAVRALHSS